MPQFSRPARVRQTPVGTNHVSGTPAQPPEREPSKRRLSSRASHGMSEGLSSPTRSPGSRRPLRHGSAHAVGRPMLSAKTVAWALAGVLVLIAGLTALLWLALNPDGTNAAQTPLPHVTVTASPDVGAGPITAPGAPQESPPSDQPAVVVGPGIDLTQHSLDDPASPWVVVNKARPIEPQSWAPSQLESVSPAQMVPQAAAALRELIDDAAAADLRLRTGTGYRAYGFQQSIYADYAAEFGAERADRFSARAGYSEHQTGWAVDVYSSEQCRLQECFADEPAGVWLAAHAHEHGFVIRYPQGSEHVTGYRFEPWHIRYVGPELATAMRERDILTLEQAFGLPAAPSYD